jgi:hypothetical protein
MMQPQATQTRQEKREACQPRTEQVLQGNEESKKESHLGNVALAAATVTILAIILHTLWHAVVGACSSKVAHTAAHPARLPIPCRTATPSPSAAALWTMCCNVTWLAAAVTRACVPAHAAHGGVAVAGGAAAGAVRRDVPDLAAAVACAVIWSAAIAFTITREARVTDTVARARTIAGKVAWHATDVTCTATAADSAAKATAAHAEGHHRATVILEGSAACLAAHAPKVAALATYVAILVTVRAFA